MDVEFDPAKDESNRRKHGWSLADAEAFEFESAVVDLDDRYDYGEDRWIAVGFLEGTLCVLVFVETMTGIRAISLRDATQSESRRYAQEAPPAF